MRKLVAGVVAGLVVFIWGAVAHMVLPIGMMGMQVSTQDDAVIASARSAMAEEGIYFVPGMDLEAWGDEAQVEAFAERALQNPYMMVIYQPEGRDPRDMGPMLMIQAVSDVLAAIIMAFVIGATTLGFGGRVLAGTGFGLFTWLALSVPYWNWYRFPTEFTTGALISLVVGWTLAGLVLAAMLKRR